MRVRSVAVLFLAAACSDPTAIDSGLEFSVVGGTASAQDPNVTVVEFVVTNTGSSPVYLPRCGENVVTEVERLEPGGWSNSEAAICQAINRMDPIRLEPGMQVSGEQSVRGTGIFRLRTGTAREPGQPVDWNVLSELFEIL